MLQTKIRDFSFTNVVTHPVLRLVATLISITFVGCSAAKPTTPMPVSVAPAADTMKTSMGYAPSSQEAGKLVAGNLIKIESFDDDKITGDYRIDSDGKIQLPYQVEVVAAGLTLDELKKTLEQSFKSYIRGTPMFTLQLSDKSVYVRALGLVNKPGAYLVTTTSSLDEVIGLAGGLEKGGTGQSAATYASIEGPGGKGSVKLSEYFAGNKSLVSGWAGGEKVFFQNANEEGSTTELFNPSYIQVMGQVRTPGEYAFNESSNIFAYLVKAGGPTDRANTSKMLLVRLEKEQVKTYPVSIDNLSEAPKMQGGDVLFVQADNPTDLAKDASIFGSFASVMSAIATTVLVGTGI